MAGALRYTLRDGKAHRVAVFYESANGLTVVAEVLISTWQNAVDVLMGTVGTRVDGYGNRVDAPAETSLEALVGLLYPAADRWGMQVTIEGGRAPGWKPRTWQKIADPIEQGEARDAWLKAQAIGGGPIY
jgi:hypothetical protein